MNRTCRALLWTARIYGALILAFILYLTSIEYMEELHGGASSLASVSTLLRATIDHADVFFPWVVACLGLVLAYWKEGLGGGITLIGAVSGSFALGFPRHLLPILPAVMFSVPSILYLIYWRNVIHARRKLLPPA